MIVLRQLLDLAGENLDNAEMVASFFRHQIDSIGLSFLNEFEIYFYSRGEPNDKRIFFWSICA